MFSSIGRFLSKLFDKLKNLLKKLWEELRPILAIAALVILVAGGLGFFGPAFLPFLAPLGALGGWGGLAAGVGAMFLIDPETGAELVENVGEAVGQIAEAAGNAVGSVAGGAVEGLFGFSIPTVLAVGVGIWGSWKLYSHYSEKKEREKDRKSGSANLKLQGGTANVSR